MITRVGFVTDLHADLEALRCALAEIDQLGIKHIICGGDIVDGGDQPEAVIGLLRERHIPTVLGNHDHWAVTRHDNGESAHAGDQRPLHLRDEDVEWLRSLPTSWRRTIEGVRVVVWHSRPGDENGMAGVYPDATDGELVRLLDPADADVLLIGHTHIPLMRRLPGGWLIANPGAL